jgi:hypothetical protein
LKLICWSFLLLSHKTLHILHIGPFSSIWFVSIFSYSVFFILTFFWRGGVYYWGSNSGLPLGRQLFYHLESCPSTFVFSLSYFI